MELQYLDFDVSDDDSGCASFDAMASVLPARLPALQAEIDAVLQWAAAAFGPAGTLEDAGEWDYDLQRVAEPGSEPRITLTLTLSGSPAFCAALRERFGIAD